MSAKMSFKKSYQAP